MMLLVLSELETAGKKLCRAANFMLNLCGFGYDPYEYANHIIDEPLFFLSSRVVTKWPLS